MQLDQILALVWAHKYIALVALLASYGSTLLSPSSAFPISIPKRARVGLVFGFAYLGAACTSYETSGQDVKSWAAAWAIHGALAAFFALGGYATLVTVVFDGNAPAWLKALAFIAEPKKPNDPSGGAPASYRTNAKPDSDDEVTQPSAKRSRLVSFARYVAMPRAAAFAITLIVGACAVQSTACNATSAQIQQTEQDSFALAGCILSTIFGGTTDPAAIGQKCAGALPSVILDIIGDFEAKPADAGANVGSSVDLREQELLDEAKAKALLVTAK